MKIQAITHTFLNGKAKNKKNMRPLLHRVNKSIHPIYLMIFIALLAFTTTSAMAQICSPSNDCKNCPDNSARLKCKFDTMANEGKNTMQMLQDSPGLLTPAQHNGMAKAKERMDREKNRLKSDDFKMLAKRKSANCQLVEVEGSGDGDGVCDPEKEDCVEVLGDGIGDDDGICWPLKGKKREVCVQICDEEAVLLDDSAMDEEAVAELEGMYDTMIGHIKEVNETVPETISLIQELRDVGDNPCVLQTSLTRNSYETYKKAKWAAMGTRAAADVAERFCDQAYGGWFAFTVGAACIGAETAVLALNTWWEVVDSVEAELDAITLDAALGCARISTEEIEQTGELITEVQGILTMVQSRNQEILQLIKIPPGKREQYPKP